MTMKQQWIAIVTERCGKPNRKRRGARSTRASFDRTEFLPAKRCGHRLPFPYSSLPKARLFVS
jgi:hypothetical protein